MTDTHDTETVERVAKAICVAEYPQSGEWLWHKSSTETQFKGKQTQLRRMARAALSAMPAPKVKPLEWLPADDRKIELGRCHGYEERIAYIGDQRHLHWYRIYPVSDGKWRWVEQFRMTYIGGNNDPDNEPDSPAAAMKAAQADYEARILGALV